MMTPHGGSGSRQRAVRILLAAAAVLGACGGSDAPPSSSTHALPDDPQEWICQDASPATQAEIDVWCAAHPDRGQPLRPALLVSAQCGLQNCLPCSTLH